MTTPNGRSHRSVNAQRDDRYLLAPEVFTRERAGCARQPRVDQRLAQRRFVDLVELDQDGGVAVEMRDGEERPPARGEHGLLLGQVGHPNGEDGSGRWRLVAEAAQIGLAEGAVPRERLAPHRPGEVAEPLS